MVAVNGFRAAMAAGLAVALGTGGGGELRAAGADMATVIKLTQVACQFIESENGSDHGFKTSRKEDCDKINSRTGADRLTKAKVFRLMPGKYIFRVTNKNVPYDLGFWLRERDYNWLNPVHKLTKISVSGGGLGLGKTREYAVDLKPGEYLYSCPLNTTPDYRLIVAN